MSRDIHLSAMSRNRTVRSARPVTPKSHLSVESAAHRPCAGEFRDRQPRTPKEQHLSVNLSGTQDRAGPRCLWKVVSSAHPPMGKGVSAIAARSPNLSGARYGSTTEGGEPQRFCAPRQERYRSVRPQATEFRRPAHRAGRRRRRHHAQDHRRRVARRTGRQGAAGRHSRRVDRRRGGTRSGPAAAGRHRIRGAGRTARAGRRQHRRGVDDRSGLLRHADAAGVAPQHT